MLFRGQFMRPMASILQICQMLDPSHFRVLWKRVPFPKDHPEYYGFTKYGITLNEITADLVGKLPPTDSRYRPDVNALENGHLGRRKN